MTTIQRSLLLNMSLLIVLVSGTILVMTNIIRVNQLVEDGATARIRGTADVAEHQLEDLFGGIRDQIKIARAWGEAGLLDMHSSDRRLEAMFQPVLENYPKIASVMLAESDGTAWMLARADATTKEIAGDPRTQTWYVGATSGPSDDGVYWTQPYTTLESRPRMTASARADFDGDGVGESVIAFDVDLESISEFTSGFYIGGRGHLFVVTENDEVVGLPEGLYTDVPLMTPVAELPFAELSLAFDAWKMDVRRRAQFFRFNAVDEHWWGGVRYFNIGRNRRFAIAVIVPEAEFRVQAASSRNTILLITLAALGVAVLMANLMARRYAGPLRSLAQASRHMRLEADRYEMGDSSTTLADTPELSGTRAPIKASGIRELDALAEDFENMATRVEQKSRELERYSHMLEQKVADRTEDLNNKNIELMEILAKLQETQQQLILQEKMASLGNLVAGVAHEINNPVGAVSGAADSCSRCVEKMQEALNKGGDARTDLEFQKALEVLVTNCKLINDGCERVTGIVRSLKTFSRLDEAEEQLADVHDGIESTLTLAQHLFKNRIEVVKKFGDIPKVMCYPNQLNQVIMNVLVNAAQAIDGKGQITIETYTDSDSVHIAVSDTGAGMAPEVLEKIFDPGFTTKGVGVGTGLGLPISHRIIDKHGGTIRAASASGKGTTIHISVPTRGKGA